MRQKPANQTYLQEAAQRCADSLLHFTKLYYKLRTGRDFELSNPAGRESHFITVISALERVFDGKSKRLIINLPPRHGKTELLIHWCAWALAQYPDSNFIYTSFSHSVAKRQTQTIRDIVQMREYRDMFNIRLRDDSQAKDEFTIDRFGGSIYGAGSGGVLTSRGAGVTNVIYRFAGAIIVDDPIKPEDALSDVVRESVNDWFYNTLESRVNSPTTPIIIIAQRTHEDDLCGRLLATGEWDSVIIPEEDVHGNILYPEKRTRKMVDDAKKFSPFVWATQYQQDPCGTGNNLYKPEYFRLLDEEPEGIASLITIDTAETEAAYNDASVFSFWSVYRIKHGDTVIPDTYGLHWVDCLEVRIEPKDLYDTFMQFYTGCLRYKIPVSLCAIERKSTGVTLSSTLKTVPGLRILDIERTKASGSKSARYIEMQPYIAKKLISLPSEGKHTQMCIKHMSRITANSSHRFDDVCHSAGTKIATIRGNINVEDIIPGDKVITPFGIGLVTAAGCTGHHKVINKFGLIATPNHKIYAFNSFKRLDTINDNDTLSFFTFKELCRWKWRKVFYSMGLNINLRGRDDIILAGNQTIKNEKVLKDCMSQFMNFIAEKQFKKAMLFTTKIMIIPIMILAILSVFHVSNILRCMRKSASNALTRLKNLSIWQKFVNKLKNGMQALKDVNGIERMQKIAFISQTNSNVWNVDCNSSQIPLSLNVAAKNVNALPMQEPIEKLVPVYNLTVEGYGVYYANGILCSNCDTAYDAVKIALIDKVVINSSTNQVDYNAIGKTMFGQQQKLDNLKAKAYRG